MQAFLEDILSLREELDDGPFEITDPDEAAASDSQAPMTMEAATATLFSFQQHFAQRK